MSENLKQRTAKGLFWAVLNSGTTQVLNLIIGIFLARLLSPEEYGIVGVLAIFTAIAGDLQSSGFTQGLINLKHPTPRDYNSVFSFNVVVSVIMYAILFLCAPLIADYFHQECLVSVSRFVFLGFFIASISIAHGGYMQKNMMNKEMAAIGALALITSGTTGITMAFLGMSYWALAWQQVVYISVITLGRYYYVHRHTIHTKNPWHTRLTLDFGPVRQMFSFAVKILITKIINTTSSNVLTFIFGRIFPMRTVGNYSQAFKWDTMASSLVTNTVGQVVQAVLVESDSQDGQELRVYRKMIRFTAFLAMPIMFGLTLISNEFILISIGKQWADCVPLLQILCLSGAFMPFYTMYQNLAISHGRSDIYMWLNIVQIILQILLILLCHQYGIVTMVTAYSAFMILWLLPWHGATGKLIGYGWLQMFLDVIPFVIISAIVMLATHYLTQPIPSPILLMLSRIVLAALFYYAILRILRVKILLECERFILKKI